MNIPRYQVNLSEHLADCEMNYLRLQKLVAKTTRVGSCLQYGIADAMVELKVLEQAPYTTSLEVSLTRPVFNDWAPPVLSVQVYHDAGLAEVVASQGLRIRDPKLPYPNPGMRQRDEKRQLNRYLGEILSHCLARGHSLQYPLKISEI